MRKIREVLRLRYECKRSQAEIAASVAVGSATVSEYLARARRAEVTWEMASGFTDAELDALLFRHSGRNEPPVRAAVDFAWVHRDLSRAGVTLQTLWIEYREGHRSERTYEYSRFCELYSRWKKKLFVSMRQVHLAGEKLFIDYSGKRPSIVDPATGVVTSVELFVAVMGASNYTYAEATHSQRLPDFVGSTVRTLEFFGAVPQILVPDQLRSAVSGPDRYEPDINPTYLEMAQHYGVTVIPARPRRPKDKTKVEGAVLIVQRWILASLRHRTFFNLGELNGAIRELLLRLNARPFQKIEGCRRSAFESIDRPAMRPLPVHRYELAEWRHAKVNIDYCVSFDHRIYSVPYGLVGEQVEIRATVSTVEILHGGVRVASHVRSYERKGVAVIAEEHRPRAHREYGKWPPERVMAWAETFGPNVGAFARTVMAHRPHPEMSYRTCLGVIRLADVYGRQRLNAACARALGIGSPTARSVRTILKIGLDRATPSEPMQRGLIEHEHIRGAEYFDKEDISDQRRDDSEANRHEAARNGDEPARDGEHAAVRAPIH